MEKIANITPMKITIGCSMKYRSLVRETMKNLSEIGITPLFPNIDYSSENKDAERFLVLK